MFIAEVENGKFEIKISYREKVKRGVYNRHGKRALSLRHENCNCTQINFSRLSLC